MLKKLLLEAHCKESDTSLFFDKGTREAKKICYQCKVRTECRDYALETFQEFGVWGGMTHHELRAYRRNVLGHEGYAPKRNWVIR